MDDNELIQAIIAKSRAFYEALPDPKPVALRARARMGSRAHAVIVAPFWSPANAAHAVGCERIDLDEALGAEDVEFEQIEGD